MSLLNFNTVSDLKAATGVVAGDTIITNGYHSVGDGGNAEYAIISSTATDDGGSVISFNDSGLSSLRAELLQASFINVKQFGAKGDDTTDDRISIQSAINFLNSAGGGTVHFPEGEYIVSKSTTPATAGLDCRDMSNLSFTGDNVGASIVKLQSGTYVGDTYIFNCNGSNYINFEKLTLDGNKQNLVTSEEQMHGIHSNDGNKLSCHQVEFINMEGDGMKLISVDVLTVRDCYFFNNGRSGITVQHSNTNCFIENNYFSATGDQPIDFEPTSSNTPGQWIISGNIINHTNPSVAITLTGRNVSTQRQNFIFSNNIILNGSVFILNSYGLIVSNNIIIGSNNWTALELRKDCRGTVISGNYIENHKAGTGALRLLWQSNVAPQDIIISDNVIDQAADGKGIEMTDIHGAILIQGNTIKYSAGATNNTCISLDTNFVDTVVSQKRYFTINGNTIENFGTGFEMTTHSTDQKFDAVTVTNNSFSDNLTTPNLTIGIEVITPSLGLDRFIDVLHIEGNTYGPSVTTENNITKKQKYYTIKSGRVPTLFCFQDPEGVVEAHRGSTAITTLSGPNKMRFYKVAGSGNTGWQNAYYINKTVLVKDLFEGTSTLASHTPNIDLLNNGWVENAETWQVGGNEVRTTTEGDGIATLETEFSDCEISLDFWTIATTTNSTGIVFRRTDNNNYWRVIASDTFHDIRIHEISSGTVSLKASMPFTIDVNVVYNMMVKIIGELIVVQMNGVDQFSFYGATSNQAATQHGLYMGSSNRYRISNFYLSI